MPLEKIFESGVPNASETDGAKIGFMLEWIPEGQMSQWARWPLKKNRHRGVQNGFLANLFPVWANEKKSKKKICKKKILLYKY